MCRLIRDNEKGAKAAIKWVIFERDKEGKLGLFERSNRLSDNENDFSRRCGLLY